MPEAWPGVIEYYKEFLPVTDATPRVTLLEGNTPLSPSVAIGPALPGKLKQGGEPPGAAGRIAPRRLAGPHADDARALDQHEIGRRHADAASAVDLTLVSVLQRTLHTSVRSKAALES